MVGGELQCPSMRGHGDPFPERRLFGTVLDVQRPRFVGELVITLRASTPRASTPRASTPRASTLRGLPPRGSTPWLVIGLVVSGVLAPAIAAAQGGPEDEPMPPSLPSDRAPGGAPTAPPPAPSPTMPPVAPTPSPPPSNAAPILSNEDPAPVTELSAVASSGGPDDGLAASGRIPAPGVWDGPNPDSFLPTLAGPIGLYRISTAEVGPVDHLRLSLHGEFFKANGFLVQGDQNSRLLGDFTFGFTVHKNVELFGALLTASNRNRRGTADAPEAGRRDPELIKSFGDLVLGGKGYVPLARGASVAFEVGLKFLSSISDLSFSAGSTSVWFGPIFTLDLQRFASANIPLRIHANVNYYVDNSRDLHDFTDTTVFTQEVASFAYGIAASRFRAALGLDAPLDKISPVVPLQPFVEYHAEIVTAGANAAFAAYMPPSCGRDPVHPCKYNRDQQWVTIGTRARVYRGFTLDAGVDVALRSLGYSYGTPLPPYNVVFGMSFPLDIDAFRRPVVVTRTIERQMSAPAPIEGHLTGMVRSGKGAAPVPGAIVAVAGRPRARVATDPDGSFESGALPPGPTALEVSAPGFESAKLSAVVSTSKVAELEVTLTPKVSTGNVRGRVADGGGHGLEASVKFLGPDNFEARSDASGAYSAALPVGTYKVMAEAPGFPNRETQLEIVAAQDRQLDLVLKNRPVNPDVSLGASDITLKRAIRLKADAPTLDARSMAELDSVADILDEHADIKSLRVEAHWDTSAGDKARDVTQKQADRIKQYLVKKGIAEARIEAVGLGADKPLVPNISPTNKAKNRRVELHVTK
jgi:outer membrane protein OmpA-like peptidoglycan-associated protein